MNKSIQLFEIVPTLESVARKILPLPKDSIVFGIGKDGLPVLYNVSKGESPNTVVWDRIAGQGIRLIKIAIEFILRHKTGLHTEFVVISNRTKEWEKLSENELGVWNDNECAAIVPFWDIVCDQVLFGLASWVQSEKATKSPVILFIDGLENADKMGESRNWLRYIMAFGRKKNIYVVACASMKNRDKLDHWLEYFQAEIYGQEKIEWLELDHIRKTIVFFTPETAI